MVNIVVCIKQVLDPEAPASAYKVDTEANQIILKGVPPVISPFDENALELALRIKDIHPAKITVLSLGRNLSKAVLRKALAVGADKLILLEDDAFEALDSYTTASVLANAIIKLGEYDIILTGIQSADINAGIVGSGIAAMLGIPSITFIQKLEYFNDIARVERTLSDSYEILEAHLPALFTVSNRVGDLRSAGLKEMMAAQKKPLTIWNAKSMQINLSQIRHVKPLNLFIPQRDTRCEFIHGENGEELGVNLAIKLKEAELI